MLRPTTQASSSAGTALNLSLGYNLPTGNNGQITSITDNTGTQEAGRSVTYTYDALYRLSSAVTTGSASYPQWGLGWSYDRYGNRLSQTQTFDGPPTNSVGVSATTNHITDPGYAYDANGNMTSDGANTLVYDAENRPLSAANGGGSGTYSYDGNGLRVQKVSGGTTTAYVFSGSKVIAEYDNGAVPASPSREYIYSGSQLLAKIEAGATTYFHPDHLSARVNTDTSGNITRQQGHFPFGESWYSAGATTTKWKFTSYERDSESQNDYAMARSYANRLARFMSPDPLGGDASDPQSLNRFAYVLNDPTNLIDPSGLLANGPKVYQPAPLDWNMWLFELFIGGVFWDRGGERSFNWNFTWAALYYYTIFNSDPGGGGDPIGDRLKKLKDLLQNDPDCLAFLNNQKMDALGLLQGLVDHNLVGTDLIAPKTQDGTISITNAQTPGTQVGQAITLNTAGAYFNSSYNGMPLSTDRGRIRGGTEPAQLFILLHELGHITDVLEHDKHNQKAVDRNDKLLEQHCKKAIKAFGK